MRGETMTWTTPTFQEIKMDAEIGSYQEDTDPVRESPILAREQSEPRAQPTG
jgi:hypothetical protein